MHHVNRKGRKGNQLTLEVVDYSFRSNTFGQHHGATLDMPCDEDSSRADSICLCDLLNLFIVHCSANYLVFTDKINGTCDIIPRHVVKIVS